MLSVATGTAGANGRARTGRAREREATAERLDSIAQAAQTAAGPRCPSSAHAVVGDGDLGPSVVPVQRDLGGARLGVFGDVRQRLRGNDVERGLVRGRDAALEVGVEDDRHRRPRASI
jgi:hypothetical protein